MEERPSFIDRSFECIALASCEAGGSAVALSAARAGGIGIIDAGLVRPDGDAASKVLTQVRWLCHRARAGHKIGLRVAPSSLFLYIDSLTALVEFSSVIIFTECPSQTAITLARSYGIARILVEARSLEEYLRLQTETNVDGVLACGNEAGGIVAEDTAFILLQKFMQHPGLDVYIRGGVGVHAAAGCRAVGARGVVLDDQLLLLQESQMSESSKKQLEGLTGTETIVLGSEFNRPVRVLDRPTFKGLSRLREALRSLNPEDPQSRAVWAKSVEEYVAWGDPAESAWPVGQAIGLAEIFRRKFETVERAVRAVLHESGRGVEVAGQRQPLSPRSALANAHGTEYPIVQGPMTRVSDQPEFAHAVAEAGGLPLIAVALLRGSQARPILEKTQQLLAEKPWGVGLLGFVPEDLRREQIEEVLRIRPKFALIAGGRDDMAISLEKEGITAYIHAPAASLLRRFLARKVSRFVFEGRECGGHVGPLCSFPLWEVMIETLLEHVPVGQQSPIDVLFAGGIHDARSAAVVSAMAALLVERGMRCGVLIGTAYLFTEEAVRSGAILERYQHQALSCASTVLLTTGVGHVVRVADTAFADEFERRRRELAQSTVSADDSRIELEGLMVGRLRLASKGVTRDESGQLISASGQEQISGGVYMLGQVATLRASVCKVVDLHRDVCEASSNLLANAAEHQQNSRPASTAKDGIAIVGIATLVPGAKHPEQFWRNMLDQVESLREVPSDRWDVKRTFDSDKSAINKAYAKWGGFVEDIPFDPIGYRIPPNVMRSISATQLLALEVTRWALADAGYADRGFDRANTGVILGTVGGGSFLAEQLYARTMAPHMHDGEQPNLQGAPEWTGEMFAGVLANVVAGRVANQFDFGGPNYGVDAACASSLVALDLAVRELESGRSNMVIAGGIDTTQTPFSYVAFSKTQALSPKGKARVFDKSADGIVISEGVCVVVLKRLEDARRDGDRVYAVIRGTGGSSDGKGLGITVPKIEGQRRAVERALRSAGITADSIGMYEAHGTGTPLGDKTELDTLAGILQEAGASPASCAVGSVKSLIGHTKTAAGIIGVAKAALALHHRTLPPHSGATEPLDLLRDSSSPVYILQRPRPWLANGDCPRRVGVSAFGFGGTNSHAVLEEAYGFQGSAGAEVWPCELMLFGEESEQDLLARLAMLRSALQSGAKPRLADLAYTLAASFKTTSAYRLAIVAKDLEELGKGLAQAEQLVRREFVKAELPNIGPRVMFRGKEDAVGSIAFLFPGQGSQYPNMTWEQALYIKDVREALELADQELFWSYNRNLSGYVFPPAAFSREAEDEQRQNLAHTHRAQPAIGAISIGMLDLLERIGVRPQMAGGHSYGELVALAAAGVLSRRSLLRLSEVRGRLMAKYCNDGGMISVKGPREQVASLLAQIEDVVVANHNGPQQTVISGTSEALQAASEVLTLEGLKYVRLQVAGAFHSRLMAPAVEPWRSAIQQANLCPPAISVFGNADGALYAEDVTVIANRLAKQIISPVEFCAQIKNMYDAGARTFIEVGPGTVLTSLASSILEGLPATCISLDSERGQLRGLLTGIAGLVVQGAVTQPARLFEGRHLRRLSLDKLLEETRAPQPSRTAWWLNGTTARPMVETPVEFSAAVKAEPTHAASRTTALRAQTVVAEPKHVPVPQTSSPETRHKSSVVHLSVREHQNAARQHDGVMPTPVPPPSIQADRPDIHSAYIAYQETMRRFLALEEQALAGFFALSRAGEHSGEEHHSVATITGRHNTPSRPPVEFPGSHKQDSLKLQHATPSMVQHEPRHNVASASSVAEIEDRHMTTAHESESSTQNNLGANGVSISDEQNPGREELTRILLAVVSERTGYPVDMLGLDLDIEAELGIDSLRRMEIMEVFLGKFSGEKNREKDGLDHLLRAKTLGQIIAVLDEKKQEGQTREINAELPANGNGVHSRQVLDRQAILEALLSVVSERTGYPTDMLGLDLDIEAELGVDSLRRMEIIETFLGKFAGGKNSENAEALEHLLRAKTLKQIVDALDESRSSKLPPERESREFHAQHEEISSDSMACPRLIPTAVHVPLGHQALPAMAGKSVLLVEDELGVAALVERTLTKMHAAVIIITRDEASDRERLRERLKKLPDSISAVIHLAALSRTPVPADFNEWQRRTQIEAKSLFHILNLSAAPLLRSAAPRILAATAMDGCYGRKELSAGTQIGGASVGLLKSLAIEWPQAIVKTVDFDLAMGIDIIAERILAELVDDGVCTEIGYTENVRSVFANLPAAHSEPAHNVNVVPDASWVVLATGGARGITSEILHTLVKPGMTVVLVGRSPASQPENAETRGLSETELRRYFIEDTSRKGQLTLPAGIEALVQRVLLNREREKGMKALQDAGANVVYHSCDVCDPQAFPALIKELYAVYGRIDAVLHGAGIVEDKLLADKDWQSFDRVFDTKVNSAYLLAQNLDFSRLKLCVFFGSVSGRFGNSGQTDYAAANEVLNRIAWWLSRRASQARVICINWGPWESSGMATDRVRKVLAERGILPISSKEGTEFTVKELLYGAKDQVEIVAGFIPTAEEEWIRKQTDQNPSSTEKSTEMQPQLAAS